MNKENVGVTEQLCAFMELNAIEYLQTRQRKAHYLVTTVIESEDCEQEEDQEEE